MNKRTITIALAAILAVAVWWLFFSASEEDAVRRQFQRLEALVAKQADEPPLQSVKVAAEISELFGDAAAIEIAARSFTREYGRDEIKGYALMARGSLTEAALEFHDLQVELTGEGTAQVVATARLTGMAAGERFADAHEIAVSLRKVEGDWLFQKATVVEVLQR